MRPNDPVTGDTREGLQRRRNTAKTQHRRRHEFVALGTRGLLEQFVAQLGLLLLSQLFEGSRGELDLHPDRVGTRTPLDRPVRALAKPHDLPDQRAAPPALASCAAGVPTAQNQTDGADVKQGTSVSRVRVPNRSVS